MTTMDLGALVRQHRTAKNLTQEELAEWAGAGITVETISNLERGKTRPYRSTIDGVIAALELSEADTTALLSAWRDAGGAAKDGSLQQGRAAASRRAWAEAYALLSEADVAGDLEGSDLALLAECAWALGHYDAALRLRERAHAKHLAAGVRSEAAWLATIIATDYVIRLELAVASGWISATERILEGEPECPAHGLLAWAQAQIKMVLNADFVASLQGSEAAIAIGKRTGAPDVHMLGLSTRGRTLIKQGHVADGMALLDEAMASAVNGQLSAWAAGFVYCNTLGACQEVADARRAVEWTAATRRCNKKDAIIPSSGHCRAHRAGILRQHGDWREAEEDAVCGCAELQHGDLLHIGMAQYELGLIRLRRGQLHEAEEAFQRAHELGRPPQPGLALLRLAQGKVDAALASITGALDEGGDPLSRAALLLAQVEIALAAARPEAARSALEEQRTIAKTFDTAALQAHVANSEGWLALHDADVAAAVSALRLAVRLWGQVSAPYEMASARVSLAEAYRLAGDVDSAALELAAARAAFERLGAAPDVQRAADRAASLH